MNSLSVKLCLWIIVVGPLSVLFFPKLGQAQDAVIEALKKQMGT